MPVTTEAPRQPRYISSKQLCEILNVKSLAALMRMVRAGTILAPIRFSERVVRWDYAALEAALARLAERAEGGATHD